MLTTILQAALEALLTLSIFFGGIGVCYMAIDAVRLAHKDTHTNS